MRPPSFADQQEAIQDAKILHWTGPLKPWLSAAVETSSAGRFFLMAGNHGKYCEDAGKSWEIAGLNWRYRRVFSHHPPSLIKQSSSDINIAIQLAMCMKYGWYSEKKQEIMRAACGSPTVPHWRPDPSVSQPHRHHWYKSISYVFPYSRRYSCIYSHVFPHNPLTSVIFAASFTG